MSVLIVHPVGLKMILNKYCGCFCSACGMYSRNHCGCMKHRVLPGS